MNTTRFGSFIRECRQEQGIKREELAEQLEISYSHLNNIELGNRLPSLELIIELAHRLKVTSGELFELFDDLAIRSNLRPCYQLSVPGELSGQDLTEIQDFIVFKLSRRQNRTDN